MLTVLYTSQILANLNVAQLLSVSNPTVLLVRLEDAEDQLADVLNVALPEVVIRPGRVLTPLSRKFTSTQSHLVLELTSFIDRPSGSSVEAVVRLASSILNGSEQLLSYARGTFLLSTIAD